MAATKYVVCDDCNMYHHKRGNGPKVCKRCGSTRLSVEVNNDRDFCEIMNIALSIGSEAKKQN